MRPATLAGCGAIALWSTLGLLSRTAAALPPLQLTAMAFAVSAALGLGLLARRGELAVLRQRGVVWLHGVFGLFGFHAFYFAALAWAPPAEANLINYLWPLFIVLFSAALPGMRLNRWHIAGVACGLAGCVLLLGGGAGLRAASVPGYLMALGSALTWAVYSVLARRLAAVPTGAVAGFCTATAILAAASHFAFEATVAPDATMLLGVLVLGIGPVGAAFFLWDLGMKRGDPRLLATLAYATPVISTLLLAAGGFAELTTALAGAAALVALGGLLAARGALSPAARRAAPRPILRAPHPRRRAGRWWRR
ncbi:MAG: EamA family transporter [Acetobacteraceae bacterium]|nr:EamA family transporter [Acetobacteraceae bacterium]